MSGGEENQEIPYGSSEGRTVS